MKSSLKNRWEPFCQAGAKRALTTLKKENSGYKSILDRASTLERSINTTLGNQNANVAESLKNKI